MLTRALATLVALLLACLGSEVGAYARAERLVTYDGANNLIREETPNGAQIDSSYDELNRRVSRLLQGAAAPGAWSGSRFSFDANGKVLTESTEVTGLPAWTRTRQYDRQERLIFERDGDGGTLATTYDPQNNRLTLTDSAGDLTRYTYDQANRLTSVAAPAIGTTEYRYNTASQLIERTGQGGYSSVTAFDPAGRVQRIEHRIGGTPTLTLEYDYDRNGNRAEQRLTHAGSGLERTSYAYDNADRLTRSTRTPPTGNALETTWTLDAVGNRTLEEVRELGSLTQRTAYSYDLRDRLQTATPSLPTGPPTAYQYDADGNVSSEQIGSAAPTQYRWDARVQAGCLQAHRCLAGGAGGVRPFCTTYAYLATGSPIVGFQLAFEALRCFGSHHFAPNFHRP